MSTRKIKRITFLAIKKQLATTTRTQADIAADYEVSAASVDNINKAGTYDNYLAHVKAAKPIRTKRAPRNAPKPLVKRVEAAKKAGLKPVTREERQERLLAKDLKDLDQVYINGINVKSEFATHSERIKTVYEQGKQLRDRVQAHGMAIAVLYFLAILGLVLGWVR